MEPCADTKGSFNKLKFIFNNYFKAYALKHPTRVIGHIRDTVNKISFCRTEIRGGKLFACLKHKYGYIVPFSCGNRFCVTCSSSKTGVWIEKAIKTLTSLDTPYHFITFTVPSALSRIIQLNKGLLLSSFFKASSGCLLYWSKRRGFLPGMILIMQTSGDRLNYHVHIHLLITSGGLSLRGDRWIKCFHYPPKPILRSFKMLIYRALRRAFDDQSFEMPPEYAAYSSKKSFNRFLDSLWNLSWNLDISESLKTTKEILEYIARYLKKPPISNKRIIDFDDKFIRFRVKDREKRWRKTPYLMAMDYFLMCLFEHIPLPSLRMIRWYGLFSNRNKKQYMEVLQRLIPVMGGESDNDSIPLWRRRCKDIYGVDPLICPVCKKEMKLVAILNYMTMSESGLYSFEKVLLHLQLKSVN